MPGRREDEALVVQLKLRITTEFKRFEKNRDAINAGRAPGAAARPLRGVKAPLEQIRANLTDLEVVIMRLLALMQDQEQATYMDNWITYSDTMENKVVAAWAEYDAMDGAVPDVNPHTTIVKAALKKVESHTQQTINEIANCSQLLTEDTAVGDDGEPKILNKLQARVYSQKISTIKLMIWPGMADALEELCKKDINKADDYHEQNTDRMASVVVPFNKLMADYAGKKFTQDCDELNTSNASSAVVSAAPSVISFMAPPSHSTILNSSQAAFRSNYQDKERLPVFSGDYSEYQLWKKEWQNAIMPGRDDAWIKRNLATKTQVARYPDLSKRIRNAKTPADAWKILDQLFQNPTVVAQHVIREFTNLRPQDLDNFSPQSQLANLETKLSDLLQDLEAVEEDHQLKQLGSLLFHAIDLLPRIYKTEFNNGRQEAEQEVKRLGGKYTGAQLLQLLRDFLEKKASQFRQYEPDVLIKKSKQITTFHRQGGQPENEEDQAAAVSSDLQDLSQERQDAINKIWERNGKCPICGVKGHTWKGEKGIMASDQVSDCLDFRKMKVDDRIRKYKSLKLCRRCLSWTHTVDQCTRDTAKIFCKKKDDHGVMNCKKDHATLLCGGTINL